MAAEVRVLFQQKKLYSDEEEEGVVAAPNVTTSLDPSNTNTMILTTASDSSTSSFSSSSSLLERVCSGYGLLVVLLCLFSFFSFFDPSSPFLVLYFETVKGLLEDQIFNQVFPVWTYSQFFVVLLLGILSETYSSGYKQVILLGVVGSIVENLLMIFGSGLRMMQLVEVTVAIKFAGSLVFSSFIYRLVPQSHFQKITSYTRACFLLGSITSSLIGQLLVAEDQSLVLLLYIALFSSGIAAILGIALPSQSSTPSSSPLEEETPTTTTTTTTTISYSSTNYNDSNLPSTASQPKSKFVTLWSDVVQAYREVMVLSIWVAISLGVHTLVMTYWQSLFASIDPNANGNGYVFSSAYILAALSTLIPPRIEHLITKAGERWLLCSIPFLTGGCLLLLGLVRSILPAYVVFVVYHCIFEFTISIAYSRVASRIPSPTPQLRRFALVFSINNTASMVVQVILQLIQQLSNMTQGSQFVMLSVTLFLLGLICVARFLLFPLLSLLCSSSTTEQQLLKRGRLRGGGDDDSSPLIDFSLNPDDNHHQNTTFK